MDPGPHQQECRGPWERAVSLLHSWAMELELNFLRHPWYGKNPANLKSSMSWAQYFTLPSRPLFPQGCECLSVLPLWDFLQGKCSEPSGIHFRRPRFFFFFFFSYSFLPISDWPLSLLTFLPFLPACPGQFPRRDIATPPITLLWESGTVSSSGACGEGKKAHASVCRAACLWPGGKGEQ